LFGLAVLKQAFPEAKILALPATVNAAKTGWPARQKFWLPTYGNNIPGPDPVLPEELTTPFLTLEGQQFPVTGPVPGSDGAGNSFVFIPSLKAVVTDDSVFDHVYFGVQRDKAREDWSKTIDQIMALKPEIIVPGHEGPGRSMTPRQSLYEEVHRRLGCQRQQIKTPLRCARCVEAIAGFRHGIHTQRPINTYFPAQTPK
jgi:glyoxylase-like metal-dependent hydrolase (beta-lactamase superfamily II)